MTWRANELNSDAPGKTEDMEKSRENRTALLFHIRGKQLAANPIKNELRFSFAPRNAFSIQKLLDNASWNI